MAKDFVGLNICVRDIFQGVGDCGHSSEIHGFSALNTLGFTSSNITSLNTTIINLRHIRYATNAGLNSFEITASVDGEDPRMIKFGLATGSMGPQHSNCLIDVEGLDVNSNVTDRMILAQRIDEAIRNSFNLKRVQPIRAHADSSPENDDIVLVYEHCYSHLTAALEVYSHGTQQRPKLEFFGISGSAFYNAVPNGFVSTPGLLHAINLHRNGPYGWPSWKMVRSGENRINQVFKKK